MGIIKKQGLQNIVISYLGVIIGVFNILFLQPHILKPEELGLTRILYSTSILFATLFPLGLNGITIKFLPQFRDYKNGHNGFFGLLMGIGLVSYLFFSVIFYFLRDYFLSNYVNSNLFVEYFNFIFIFSFLLGFNSIINVYAFALFKTSIPTFINEVLNRLLNVILISVYFLKLISFDSFMVVFVLIYGLQLILLIAYLLKYDKISFRINFQLLRSLNIGGMVKYGLLMIFATLASMALRNIDILLLGSKLSQLSNPLNEVAVYGIALTIASIIETPVTALGKISDSKISDAFIRNDLEMVRNIYFNSTNILLLIGGYLFIEIFINIHDLLVLFPEKYADAENVVKIISLSALFNMATGVNGSILFYSNKYLKGAILLLFCIVISLVLNVLLIPHWGKIGAAIATGAALLFYNLGKFIVIKRDFGYQPLNRDSLACLVLIVVTLFLGSLLRLNLHWFFNVLIRFAITSSIYLIGIIKLNLHQNYKALYPKSFISKWF